MKTITRRGFLAGLACAEAISAKAGATAHGYRKLYPRTYDDGLIPRFSFEVIEISLGGRLGAYVLDLVTGRSSSWSSNAEFDATPVAGPMLIAAAQWAIAEGKLQGAGRYSTCPAAGVFHRAAPDDLCSSIAAAPDPASTAALHKILADRQLLSGFLRQLDGGRKKPASATAGVISCAAEP